MFSKILKIAMLVTVAGTSVCFAQPVVADEIILPSTRLMVVPEETTTQVMLAPTTSVIGTPVTVIERPVIKRKSHFFSRSLHNLVNVVDMDDDDDELILNGVKVEIDD